MRNNLNISNLNVQTYISHQFEKRQDEYLGHGSATTDGRIDIVQLQRSAFLALGIGDDLREGRGHEAKVALGRRVGGRVVDEDFE